MRPLWAVMLCIALLGCQAKKSASVRIDPSLEALVPSDTVFVAGANVEAVRETPVYQKLLSRVPLPQLDEFTRRTGLDPRKDLTEILSCSNGKHGVLMARGRFKVGDLESRLEAQGARRSGYKNQSLFGIGQVSFLFLNASTAVVGPEAELDAIIDRNGASNGGLPPALRDLVRAIPGDDQIWAALTGGLQNLNLAAPANSNLENVINALKTIDTATLGMNLRNGFDLNAEVSCKTERDAKFVHDMVKGIVGFGRLNTPDNHPELLQLYDAIKVSQVQNRALVAAQIPTELADRFLDLWLKH